MASFIAGVAADSANGNSVTSGAIDTTGSDLIVVALGLSQGSTATNLSDNKSNSWTRLTPSDTGSSMMETLFYCQGPTVGSGHTFTFSETGKFPGLAVAAFSGSLATPLDQQNGANAVASSVSTGSVTPGFDNEILVAGWCTNGTSNDAAIDSGFTIAARVQSSAGASFGAAIAYLLQTTAAAKNPSCSNPSSSVVAATIATFKGSAPSVASNIKLFGFANGPMSFGH